jgi:hypothetical protein
VTLKVEPNSLLIPFTGFAVSGGTVGIQVGATFYPNPSPAHGAMQWLTLDRSTLKPTGSGNSWFDGTADGPHGLSALAAAVAGENLDQLVILSYPFAGGPGPPVAPGQMDGFNAVLKTIGVGPIGADILQDHNKLVIAGVPTGGPGSGWYIHGGGPVDGLNGWLMPDTTDNAGGFARYRVQPERPMFDTSSAHTPTTNTMTIRSQKVTDSLPGGASGGFQVAFINPTDFTVSEHRAFATNGGDGSGVTAMAAYLDSQVGGPLDVAVQSIGQVTNPSPRENPSSPNPGDDAWRAVTTALTGFGANPQTFYTADGSYAFLGGTQLERSEVVQSSKTSANDPGANPPQGQSGTLSGRVSMRADGYFIPAAVDAYDKFGLSLYDKVLVPSTPWPYTAAAGEKQPGDYTAALTYISGKLPDLAGWAPDLRQAYIGAPDDFRFSDSKVDLAGLPYPGDGNTCSQSPGSPVQPAPSFTREEFCALSTELQSEFDWIDATKDLFDTYEKALNRSGNLELVNLQNLGETIRKDVDASGGSLIGWSVGSFIGDGLAAGLGLGPEEGAAGWEALVAVYELIRDLVSEGGSPVGDELTSKVSELSSDTATRLSEAANGLDRLRDVILSDYGRLQAVGSVATGPDWAIDTVTTTNTLTTAASAFFSTQLIPIGFTDVFYLAASPTNGSGDQTPNNCEGPFGTHPYGGAPASGYVQWRFGFNTPDFGPAPSGLWVLTDDDGDYAPANVTDPTFHSVAQGGYGVYLNDFLWQQYKSPPTGDYQCR